jgi:hypothetical protein
VVNVRLLNRGGIVSDFRREIHDGDVRGAQVRGSVICNRGTDNVGLQKLVAQYRSVRQRAVT